MLVVSLLVVFSELLARAAAGYSVPKDLNCLNAALVYWASVENYTQALLLIFFIHGLAPLELDLLELTDLQGWYSC